MKKILSTIVLFIAIFLFGGVPTYGADTATFVTLNARYNFTMELKSDTLVFNNAPINKEYYGVVVLLQDERTTSKGVTRLAVGRGKSKGCIIDLNGLVDGTYTITLNCREVDYLGTAIGSVWSEIKGDLDGDGVKETYETIEYNKAKRYYYRSEDEDEDEGEYIRADIALEEDLSSDEYIMSLGHMMYSCPVELVIKKGKASFKAIDIYENNMKYISQERTDKTVLKYNKKIDKTAYSDEYIAYLNEEVEKIVANISSDYDRAKAIHKFAAENLWYILPYPTGTIINSWNYFVPNTPFRETLDLIAGDTTVCGGYAEFEVNLLRAAGFSAKVIYGEANGNGSWSGHAWVEVWIDNRWVFADPTWDTRNYLESGEFTEQRPYRDIYFDMPVATYSLSHKIDVKYMIQVDDEMLSKERTLCFISTGNRVLKIVNDFTVGELLTSTYGFNAEDLFWDWECTKPFNLATDKIETLGSFIYVKNHSKTYTIKFNTRGGTPIDSIKVIAREEDNYGGIPEKPANPTKKGYKFVGWSRIKPVRNLKWNEYYNDFGPTYSQDGEVLFYMDYFGEDPVYKSGTYYAVWEANAKYKVTLQSNGGTSIKAITVTAKDTISIPTAPTRKGFKFVGWYKDARLTKVWNFKTSKVTGNTTLYAKWKKI